MLKKLFLVSLFCGIGSTQGMQPIHFDPLTEKEVEDIRIWKFLKAIEPEYDEPDIAWKSIATFKNGDNAQWVDVAPDEMSRRLGKTEVFVLSKLYAAFHRYYSDYTFEISRDKPVEQWPSFKKAFALFEVLGASSSNARGVGEGNKACILEKALWQDDSEFAQYVISRGVHPNYVLHHSGLLNEARSGKMMNLLVKLGAQCSPLRCPSLLHHACGRNVQADLVTFCIEQGFDVNELSAYKQTPLAVIASTSFYEPIERVEPKVAALLKAGGDITIQCEGETLTEIALGTKKHNKQGHPYYPQTVDRFVELIKEAEVKK